MAPEWKEGFSASEMEVLEYTPISVIKKLNFDGGFKSFPLFQI